MDTAKRKQQKIKLISLSDCASFLFEEMELKAKEGGRKRKGFWGHVGRKREVGGQNETS